MHERGNDQIGQQDHDLSCPLMTLIPCLTIIYSTRYGLTAHEGNSTSWETSAAELF